MLDLNPKSMRKPLQALLQMALSVGLIALALQQIDLASASNLLQRIRQNDWATPLLLGSLALFNASKIISALRLNSYQRQQAIDVGHAENLQLYYAGMFLNLFLPGGIGGDAYKILVLRRRAVAPVVALIRTTLADRVSGLFVLLMLSCWLWALPALKFSSWMLTGAALLLFAVFIGGHRWLFKMQVKLIFKVFSYGLAVQLLQLGCMTLLLLTLQVPPAALAPYLAVFLLSSVAAVLPLSIGGLGVRELSFVYGMQLLRLDPVPGVLASSGFFFITLISSLVGVVFLRRFSATP